MRVRHAEIEELDTPAVVIDQDIAEANLRRAQAYADRHGLGLRPHIKTHKLPHFAHMQIALGAVGITCQKLGEAEVMADAGLEDIFIAYNMIGREKLDRLHALHRRSALSVAADSPQTIAGYAARFADAGHPLRVLVECDTGAGRCGVQSPAAAVDLARTIDAAPGLTFEGLMTYPPLGRSHEVNAWLEEAISLLGAAGLRARRISNGGSPEFYQCAAVTAATEHRPGTYIYSDRTQVSLGHGALEDCALKVLATVVSRPTASRAILDAGSKALAADLCRMPGHGTVIGYGSAVITGLSEEHAIVDTSACPASPTIGEKVCIIPNHACVVSNLFDAVHLVSGGRVVDHLPVAARGRLS